MKREDTLPGYYKQAYYKQEQRAIEAEAQLTAQAVKLREKDARLRVVLWERAEATTQLRNLIEVAAQYLDTGRGDLDGAIDAARRVSTPEAEEKP